MAFLVVLISKEWQLSSILISLHLLKPTHIELDVQHAVAIKV